MKKINILFLLSSILVITSCNKILDSNEIEESNKSSEETNNENENESSESNYLYPNTYYGSITIEETGETLLKDLSKIIKKGAKTLSYDSDLYPAYKTTDTKPNSLIIWDMYSTFSYTYGTDENHGTQTGTYNREHMIPQSWFSGITTEIYSDLFNVYPTDSQLNAKRGNYPHGDNSSKNILANSNNCTMGTSSLDSSVGTVFEVDDEYKGDIARTYLYAVCRYYSDVGSYKSEAQKIFKSSFPYLTNFGLNQYLSWSKLDPVSQKEIDRNEAVYKLQKNRNPFIDHEELIYKIWDLDYYNLNYNK